MAFKKVRPHKKVCYFKKNNVKYIDYKDVETLKIDNPQGILKGSIGGHRTVLFNGADDCPDLSVLQGLRFPEDVRVYACSEKEGKIYERIR